MVNKKTIDKTGTALVPQEIIERKIFLIRGKKVMIDSDLAQLYDVPTKSLNLAVKRNIERFPPDFMFRLTVEEYRRLRFHFETSKKGGRRYLPYVFTEQGVAMLSGVLSGTRAVQVNITIMRVFVQLKEIISHHVALAKRLEQLEKRMEQKDEEVQAIFQAIRDLMEPPRVKRKPKIGFHS